MLLSTSNTKQIRRHHDRWSIGIYSGQNPFKFDSPNGIDQPVLKFSDVIDVNAEFVADPFMLRHGDDWLMFFEVYNHDRQLGEIGLAQSIDGFKWNYQQIILSEPWHLSYPYVFEWEGQIYMIPETLTPGAIKLYQATDFPLSWKYVKDLVSGRFADSSIIRHQGYWYIFTCSTPYTYSELKLYMSATLTGEWTEHPKSPIVKDDPQSARPGGRMLVWDSKIIRYAQDCLPRYGSGLRAFIIDRLDPLHYEEHPWKNNPVLEMGGEDWRGAGMHHIDAHEIEEGKWIACVDGKRNLTEQ